jgi:uncharacterized membrane protein YraQ (UPF0718 family)
MNKCCPTTKKKKFDWLLWGSVAIIIPFYIFYFNFSTLNIEIKYFSEFAASVFELLNKMWWGVLLGIFFVGVLDKIPREFIMSALGGKKGVGSILRATAAGLALDLCSHGILLVGMKLYERGASLGQVMAFLIASPWNSFSLTLILWALIGLKWTFIFIGLSAVVAVVSGLIFEKLVDRKILPANPNKTDLPDDFKFFAEAKKQFKNADIKPTLFGQMLVSGLKGSRMILRWLLFGVILASLIRTFVPVEHFQTFFGPTLAGLAMTIVAATIIEVCSEGSTPIAADIMTRAGAPGNTFAFLMTGVSTDYTEIMSLKETTKSWKISLFLPLVTVPQVVALGYLLNGL